MTKSPKGNWVQCPGCGDLTIVLTPPDSAVIEEEATADGQVRTKCFDCQEQFVAYYRFKDN